MIASEPPSSSNRRRITYSLRSNASWSSRRVCSGDDELPDERCGRGCRAPGELGVDRHVAPADDRLALVLDDRREQLLELVPALGVVGEEAHRDAVAPGRGQLLRDDGAEERVGDLHQDAGTVARARIGAGGAAMLEVGERFERPPHGLVQRLRVESRDERDAARVVLAPSATLRVHQDRPQAVAVERRPDHAPVGERHRRRAVPRLHQALVVA